MKNNISALLVPIFLCITVITARSDQPRTNDDSRRNLVPAPMKLDLREGRLSITHNFTVAVKDHLDERLQAAIERMMRRLEGRTGLTLARGLSNDPVKSQLLIQCQGPGKPVPELGEDESYSLQFSDKQAALSAATVTGVLRGLETFLQLLDGDRNGFFISGVNIDDKPRFPWRGLMIDSSRHFQPLEVIKRNLDAMAAVKLNVFHWHLTDDQGFRVETRKYPKFHQLGSDGFYYTQEQIKAIVAYAAARGIRVVPEFDLPGHATSWLVGMPELGSAPGPYRIEREPGIFDPVLDPTREEVYAVLDGLFGEVTALFPDQYFHIGGDENEGKQWDSNPQIAAFKREKGIKSNHELQAYLNHRLAQILGNYAKKMIGWEEILHPGIPKNAIIHSWRGSESLAEAAKKGFSGILSAGYYIDLMYPASNHYSVDPVPANNDLSPEQISRILGGEATMWSEYVSPETIDSRIWPRTAAIAERLWSPRNVTDVDEMYRRLAIISTQLEELGLTHERNVDVLLRRMSRSREIGPLQTLLGVIEPVKQYNRGKQHPTTMLSPLTSLVDAARPDSEASRRFARLTERLSDDSPQFRANHEDIREMLIEWRDLRHQIEVLAKRSPMLNTAESLANSLSEIATIGLEGLTHLTEAKVPEKAWREKKLGELDKAAKPRDALEFNIVEGVRKIVVAAADQR